MKRYLEKALYKLGYSRINSYAKVDFSESEKEIIRKVRPFTMTSDERIISLIRAVDYISQNHIDGDFVECGVWRGGSAMAAALRLKALNDTQRKLYLYDTFEGMSKPTEVDREYNGRLASEQLATTPEKTGIWCYASLEDVTNNLQSTEYPRTNIRYIKGKVEETIPSELPDRIAILRLDTDWYESTLHELQHLFPLLDPRGLLIVDDYGHWQGCREAVDEYFSKRPGLYYFHRIDYAGRLIMKVSDRSQ